MGTSALPHLPPFFTWYYASSDNNSHWATPCSLGVDTQSSLLSLSLELSELLSDQSGEHQTYWLKGMLRRKECTEECSAGAKTLLISPHPTPVFGGKLEKGGRSQVLTMGSQTGLRGGVTQLWGYHS